MNYCNIEVNNFQTCSAVISALKTMQKMVAANENCDLLSLAVEALISIKEILPDAILTETASGYGIIFQSVILMEFTRAEQ